MEAVYAWLSHYGYPALFALLMLGIVGLPVPDETLLTFCGYLIWKHTMHPAAALLTAIAGSATGITVSYLLGRSYGHRVIYGYGKYIGLTAERLARVHAWFDRTGPWLLAIGYFIPGVRHFTALVAGTTELRWPTFALFAYAGAAVWCSVFLTLGYVVGENWQHAFALFHKYTLEASAIAAALIVAWWLFGRRRKPC
ncbi:MAG TPA: DedA family protein [Bryobacteraceae bacterium]|jgi:membrane protein DedA with SNARE-associated domain|nr:DedA family protein [Bryobacteraceae bacterium]